MTLPNTSAVGEMPRDLAGGVHGDEAGDDGVGGVALGDDVGCVVGEAVCDVFGDPACQVGRRRC